MRVRFRLNGRTRAVEAPPLERLLDTLRDRCGATGAKEGCGEGECGACAVLVDGEVVNSCLTAACQVEGRSVTTVEGLARGDRLHPLQRAFWECGAAQCGICTPGMLMSARAYLDDGGSADEASIREAIAGNLCRCTGYTKIVEAIAIAASQRGSPRPGVWNGQRS